MCRVNAYEPDAAKHSTRAPWSCVSVVEAIVSCVVSMHAAIPGSATLSAQYGQMMSLRSETRAPCARIAFAVNQTSTRGSTRAVLQIGCARGNALVRSPERSGAEHGHATRVVDRYFGSDRTSSSRKGDTQIIASDREQMVHFRSGPAHVHRDVRCRASSQLPAADVRHPSYH